MEKITNDLIFSGVQPTGNLHLGNYLGAIKNWVELQNTSKCIFCIVDLHAFTVPKNCTNLKKNIFEVAAAYIAAGIDPKKNIIFIQSHVSHHSELSWILSCFTPIGWLNRMTQFKDKAGKNKEKAPLGLYSYPVLMAADILLYKANKVPVGDDQKQHLELSRNISQAFNRFYKTNFFPIPEPLIIGSAARVMSLRDGTKKMSKSDPSDFSRINLKDSGEEISKKIQKAKTDSLNFPKNETELEIRPEIKNLINIFSSISNVPIQKVLNDFQKRDFIFFKESLKEILNQKINSISLEMQKILKDETFLKDILKDGAEKANEIAGNNMKRIKDIMGFF
tara:strand:+ start:4658 stop:5665 length:1008 start_codon:yes stop_codon:yes gene_type:complete